MSVHTRRLILVSFLGFLVLWMAGCTAPTSYPPPTPYKALNPTATRNDLCRQTLYVSVSSDTRANVRSGPDLSASIVGKAYRGDRFCAYEKKGEWWYGEVRGLTGYVHLSLLDDVPPDTSAPSTRAPSAKCYATPPPGCNIKGNISFDTSEKIYHLPGDEYYDCTEINPAYGECWFCSEADARALGWRRAYK